MNFFIYYLQMTTYQILKKCEHYSRIIGFLRQGIEDNWILDAHRSSKSEILDQMLKELYHDYNRDFITSTNAMNIVFIESKSPPLLRGYNYIILKDEIEKSLGLGINQERLDEVIKEEDIKVIEEESLREVREYYANMQKRDDQDFAQDFKGLRLDLKEANEIIIIDKVDDNEIIEKEAIKPKRNRRRGNQKKNVKEENVIVDKTANTELRINISLADISLADKSINITLKDNDLVITIAK
jgi:hypothetical protein